MNLSKPNVFMNHPLLELLKNYSGNKQQENALSKSHDQNCIPQNSLKCKYHRYKNVAYIEKCKNKDISIQSPLKIQIKDQCRISEKSQRSNIKYLITKKKQKERALTQSFRKTIHAKQDQSQYFLNLSDYDQYVSFKRELSLHYENKSSYYQPHNYLLNQSPKAQRQLYQDIDRNVNMIKKLNLNQGKQGIGSRLATEPAFKNNLIENNKKTFSSMLKPIPKLKPVKKYSNKIKGVMKPSISNRIQEEEDLMKQSVRGWTRYPKNSLGFEQEKLQNREFTIQFSCLKLK